MDLLVNPQWLALKALAKPLTNGPNHPEWVWRVEAIHGLVMNKHVWSQAGDAWPADLQVSLDKQLAELRALAQAAPDEEWAGLLAQVP